MKKLSLFTVFLLLFSLLASSAFAENKKGSKNNEVQFTGNEMISNFSSSDIEQLFRSIQPGDSAEAYVKVRNSSSLETLWYMHNEAIESLEESRNSAFGGYYAYKLTYTNPAGQEFELYNSDKIGDGEFSTVGLNKISESLKDYFYLDTLQPGQKGEVCLHMELEGETQGNGYQNTIASLEAQFAVEPTEKKTVKVPYTTRPRTGDDSDIMLWIFAGAASLCAVMLLKNKKIFLAGLLLFAMLTVPASAEEYSYNISVFSGEQGAFDAAGTDCITYPCKPGDPVNFSQEGLIALVNQHLQRPDKYIATGIRPAGRDNDQEDGYTPMAFNAREDGLYCITYEVKTNVVNYTVTYTTENGTQLLPPETYQANVGDRVVVAFKYVDGYEPVNARNITDTVEASSTTFNFKYRLIPKTQTEYVEVAPAADNTAGTLPAENANEQNAGNTQAAAETPQPEESAPPVEAAEAPATPLPVITPAPTPAPTPEQVITIEEPPTPVDILDLDPPQETPLFDIGDVAVPLATLQGRADLGDRSAKTALVLRRVVFPLLLAVVLGLIILLVILNKRKHRVSLADLRNSEAYSAAPASGPSAAPAYRPAWKDDPNFSDDFYFDRKDL